MKVIRGYTHHDGSIGALVRFGIGTDFTARTDEFEEFAKGVLTSIVFHHRSNPDLDLPHTYLHEVVWVGNGEFDSLEQAFENACKQFQEDIVLDEVQVLMA